MKEILFRHFVMVAFAFSAGYWLQDLFAGYTAYFLTHLVECWVREVAQRR